MSLHVLNTSASVVSTIVDTNNDNHVHSALNDQEHFRGVPGTQATQAYSSNIDSRTFHETALWPFAESVYAGLASVMCAYNRVNQTGACENWELLNGLLKEELDFQGFVLSDWTAVGDLEGSVSGGVDVNMPGVSCYFRHYHVLVVFYICCRIQDVQVISYPSICILLLIIFNRRRRGR